MRQSEPPMEYGVLGPHIRLLFAQKRPIGSWNFSNLRAPYWRLYHLSQSGAWVEVVGRRTPLSPERVYLFPANLSFSSGCAAALDQFFVHFTIEPPLAESRIPETFLSVPFTPDLQALLNRIHRCGSPARQSLLLTAFVQLVLDASGLQLQDRSLSTRLEKAQDLMRNHMQSGITNKEIARALHLSPNAFIRWYKSVTGTSPQFWLNRERVNEASFWLHHTDASMEKIAETLGFCDRYHFSRVFKRLQGVSPAAFRKNRDLPPPRLQV
ncbi:MAG: AraC family transcriptional regulator [Kiritimatiellia bacterium]